MEGLEWVVVRARGDGSGRVALSFSLALLKLDCLPFSLWARAGAWGRSWSRGRFSSQRADVMGEKDGGEGVDGLGGRRQAG